MASTPAVLDTERSDLSALLTREQVSAELGGISGRMVQRLARRGLLERVALGHRTVRYTARSVRRLVENDHEAATNSPVEKEGDAGAPPQA